MCFVFFRVANIVNYFGLDNFCSLILVCGVLFVMSALVALGVSRATNTRIEDETCEETAHYSLNVAFATSYHAYAVRREFIQCAVTHIARQHNLDTQLLQVLGYARFAAATLRRGQHLAADNLLIHNGKYRIVVAVSKVVIDLSVTRRNG